MDVTDAIAGEHGVFHLLVEQLEDALDRCATLAELRAATEPLAISLLAHAKVEEETLFQPYERRTGSLGPLRCLRHQHQQIDQRVRSLFRVEDADELRVQVRALLDLTRRHLAREEEVMFTAARDAIPADERQHQGAHWAEARGVSPTVVVPAGVTKGD